MLDVLLWQVAVDDVSEEHLLDVFWLLFEFVFLNVQEGSLKIDDEVSLWVNGGLKELDFLHKLSEVTLHSELRELADI